MLKRVAAALLLLVTFAGAGLGTLWSVSRRPDYCGWCHVMEPYFTSWKSSESLAYLHSVASIPCQECHPQSMRQLVHEIVANLRGSYSVPLPVPKVAKEECLRCHGDYAALANETERLKVNPHATHLGEEECRQCHKMHRPSPGMKYCRTCHHTGDLVRCDPCHEKR